MKVSNSRHYEQALRVHDFLKDFEVEDVWEFPVDLNHDDTLPDFYELMMNSLQIISEDGPAGFLFKLRFFLGRLFGWDENSEGEVCPPGSLRERYKNQNKIKGELALKPSSSDGFSPVFQFPDECLSEIENATVHAALHLAKVEVNKTFKVLMTVYVKPKGIFGKCYMALIKPFRLFIVYPSMMKMVKKSWENHLKTKNSNLT